MRFIDSSMFFVQKETQIRQQNDVLFDVPHLRESRKLGLTKRIQILVGFFILVKHFSTMYAGNLNLMDTWSVVITCD